MISCGYLQKAGILVDNNKARVEVYDLHRPMTRYQLVIQADVLG